MLVLARKDHPIDMISQMSRNL